MKKETVSLRERIEEVLRTLEIETVMKASSNSKGP